jgi:flavin-binding protein dodecin
LLAADCDGFAPQAGEAQGSKEPFRRKTVSGHVYKKVELIGSSPVSVNEAIETAISRASKTMRNLDWFEVNEIRGQIVNGKVAHYQVVMKVGFRIEE